MFLAKLAYPNRLESLENFFNRPKSTLSTSISAVLDFIHENYSHKISNLDQPWLTQRFQEFADAIHAKGAPLRICIGFVDGTVRRCVDLRTFKGFAIMGTSVFML